MVPMELDRASEILEATSNAIDQANAELQARDPTLAAQFRAHQEQLAEELRTSKHFGPAPESVRVTWEQHLTASSEPSEE